VIGPWINTRVVQPNHFFRGGVNGCDVAAFMSIAEHAGISQVSENRLAIVFAADDVVYLMREGDVVFVDQAVFATKLGPRRDLLSKSYADVTGHGGGVGLGGEGGGEGEEEAEPAHYGDVTPDEGWIYEDNQCSVLRN